MKIFITGTRSLSPEEISEVQFKVMKECLTLYKAYNFEYFELIHGMANGVDSAVEELRSYNHPFLKIVAVPADWSIGKSGGVLRNIKMLDMLDYRTDMVLAFHTDPKLGKGTKHCVEEALRRKIPTKIFIL